MIICDTGKEFLHVQCSGLQGCRALQPDKSFIQKMVFMAIH